MIALYPFLYTEKIYWYGFDNLDRLRNLSARTGKYDKYSQFGLSFLPLPPPPSLIKGKPAGRLLDIAFGCYHLDRDSSLVRVLIIEELSWAWQNHWGISPCIENGYGWLRFYFRWPLAQSASCFRCIEDLNCLQAQEGDDDAYEEHLHHY